METAIIDYLDWHRPIFEPAETGLRGLFDRG